MSEQNENGLPPEAASRSSAGLGMWEPGWQDRNDANREREIGMPGYQLLERGDTIKATDELLRDDCETWEEFSVSSLWEIGQSYHPSYHVPARRKIEPTHECETCKGEGTFDERIGGEWTSNPKTPCPDCDGRG